VFLTKSKYNLTNIVPVNKSRRKRWAVHAARMGGGSRDVYKVFVGKPEGQRPLGRPRRRCEDNIKMDLRDVAMWAWTGLICLRIGTGGGLL